MEAKKNILETYVICGPLFYFDKATDLIGSEDDYGVSLPIPHAYFKSILTENNRGTLDLWTFILPNKETDTANQWVQSGMPGRRKLHLA